jgi:hypothetical protein
VSEPENNASVAIRWVLGALVFVVGGLGLWMGGFRYVTAREVRSLEARVAEVENWRAECLKRGELVWFSPDGPKRVRLDGQNVVEIGGGK